MIDFRYHVVSLVAVFIALAVGIVLGAGPLREGISDTLEGEVNQLRAERTGLRSELEAAQSRAQDKDAALGAVGGRVAAGTLSGARVGVVLLPGADRNHAARVEEGLEAAGGEVVLRVDVDTDLEALEGPDDRAALVQELRSELQMGQESEVGDDQAAPEDQGPGLGPVLASALLGADAVGVTGAWLSTLDRLAQEGYVDLAWRGEARSSVLDRQPPEALLVLDGDLPTDAEGEPTRAAVVALAERGAFLDRLVQDEAALVVAGAGGETRAQPPAPETSPLVGLVRAVRDLGAEASTVDNLESAAGQLSTVLAVAWELEGQAGHYGQADAVDAPVPAPPPVRFVTPTVPPGDDALVTDPVHPTGTGTEDGAPGDDGSVPGPGAGPAPGEGSGSGEVSGPGPGGGDDQSAPDDAAATTP